MTTKTAPEPTAAETPQTEEAPKKEVMGIERDDTNARVSFTTDGNLMIITLPIGRMARATAHGFLYELHQIINDWHEERKRNKIITRDEAAKWSFKAGLTKLFK